MNSKKIATSVPAQQYAALERERKRLRLRRSEAVQQAVALWLAARNESEAVARYIAGYQTCPDDEMGDS